MCDQCNEDHRLTYRCVGCYQLFAHAIRARNLQLSKKKVGTVTFPLLDIPVFKALLGAPWESLAASKSLDEAKGHLTPFYQELQPYSTPAGPRGFNLKWTKGCPSCYDQSIKDPVAGVVEAEFKKVLPKFTREKVVLVDCPVLDDSTGRVVKKNILVDVITVMPVVSDATASHFKFRSSDGDEHVGYEVFIPTMPAVAREDVSTNIDEVWQLVRHQ
jgi:hypothetical protein